MGEAAQYSYAVRGARICCTMGSHFTKLDLPVSHGSSIRGKPMMNEKDCKVGLDQNIAPFGACTSGENTNMDIIISEQKNLMPLFDKEGNASMPPMPIKGKLCQPTLGEKWLNAQERTLVDGEPAITVACTQTCKFGGVIGFIDDGQEVAK